MPTTHSDQTLRDLMARARRGDARAYGTLLRGAIPALRGFLAERLPQPADADEMLQDVLLALHRASHTYDVRRPFLPWAFAIARYRLADHLRRVGAEPRDGPLADVTQDWMAHADLRRLLDALPSLTQRIVAGMKLEGRTAAEMGLELDMSAGAVKVAAHRALRALAVQARALEN